MTLRELKDKLEEIGEEYLDCDVLVDTEASTFTAHMVDITDIFAEDFIRPHVSIHLDDRTKIRVGYNDLQN